MQQAKAAGIDAFALNIGTDTWTEQQLNFAYQSAANNDMSVFISFDFNWYSTSMTSQIGQIIQTYGSQPGQLKVDGKVFVSSFLGDGLDLDAVASASGFARTDLFFALNFEPTNVGSVDSLFNWMAWPNNGNNKAPDASNKLTVSDGDQSYVGALGSKPYIAPVSPWFSTHYGTEVSSSKNWVFPSDLLWFRKFSELIFPQILFTLTTKHFADQVFTPTIVMDASHVPLITTADLNSCLERWTEVLTLAPQFLEIISWNDYGESHYIGPLSSPHIDDGNSKWTNDMPHDGFLEMAKPYIAAFKAGSKTVDSFIDTDQIIYWYRPSLKSADCDSTDNCQGAASPPNYFPGKPNGYDTVEDSVFIVALLKSAGTVTVTSGGNTQSFNAQAGANAFQAPLNAGKQSFALTRNSQTVLGGDSLKEVSADCVCGIYNFNAYVGTLPAGPSDSLQPDGLKNFETGLHATCQATPSLGTASAAGTGIVNVPTSVSSSNTVSQSTALALSASAAIITPILSIASTSAVAPPATSNQPPQQPSSVTPTSVGGSGSGSKTITALSQLAPTNCMHAGDVWAGPPGSDPAAMCDGG